MCLGIPGKIIEIVDADRAIAKAEVGRVRRNVSIQLLEDQSGTGRRLGADLRRVCALQNR